MNRRSRNHDSTDPPDLNHINSHGVVMMSLFINFLAKTSVHHLVLDQHCKDI